MGKMSRDCRVLDLHRRLSSRERSREHRSEIVGHGSGIESVLTLPI